LGWPWEGRELTLAADRATVDRHPQSDLVIAQVGLSSRHAEIVRMASECLTDLKSVNGASGNNLKLGRAVLTHGDVFQIGSCVFRFTWSRSEPVSR
jgi:pSer/pThr/pTyr-binding forkhead associated (FHA) protein